MGFTPIGVVKHGMATVDHIYSGYGESPNQGLITSQGASYLRKDFPRISLMSTVVVLPLLAPPPSASNTPDPQPAETDDGSATSPSWWPWVVLILMCTSAGFVRQWGCKLNGVRTVQNKVLMVAEAGGQQVANPSFKKMPMG